MVARDRRWATALIFCALFALFLFIIMWHLRWQSARGHRWRHIAVYVVIMLRWWRHAALSRTRLFCCCCAHRVSGEPVDVGFVLNMSGRTYFRRGGRCAAINAHRRGICLCADQGISRGNALRSTLLSPRDKRHSCCAARAQHAGRTFSRRITRSGSVAAHCSHIALRIKQQNSVAGGQKRNKRMDIVVVRARRWASCGGWPRRNIAAKSALAGKSVTWLSGGNQRLARRNQ